MTVGHLPDASPSADAGIDAVTRGTVHVTVLDPSGTGAPAAGANVVFIDPDGTLVKRVATDTSGKADADVLPGATVTSVVLQASSYQLQTVLDIQPGDDLVIGVKSPDSTTIGTFTVSFPASQATPSSYTVAGPCGTVFVPQPAAGGPPPTTGVLSFNNACKQDAMEIIVQANDASGNPIGVLARTGVPFVLNGATTLTGAYQSPRSFTASYSNINPNVTVLGMTRTVPDGFGLSASPTSAAPPTATQVMTVTGAIGSGALVDTQVTSASRARQIVRQVISGSAASYGLDLSATLLPWLGQPTFDAASGKILVPTDTTGTTTQAPDFVRLTASYRRTDPVSGAQTSFSWTLFSPVAADVALPNLPAEVGSVMPTAADTVSVLGVILESDAAAGYDAIRHDLNGALFQFTSSRPPGTTLRFGISPGLR